MDYHKELWKDVYSEKTQHLKLKLIKAKDIPEGKHKAVIFDSKKPIATRVIIKPVARLTCIVCGKKINKPKVGRHYCSQKCMGVASSYDWIHKKDYIKITDYDLKDSLKNQKKVAKKKIKSLNETKTNKTNSRKQANKKMRNM